MLSNQRGCLVILLLRQHDNCNIIKLYSYLLEVENNSDEEKQRHKDHMLWLERERRAVAELEAKMILQEKIRKRKEQEEV